jgi:YVTN family beta-propeller protein
MADRVARVVLLAACAPIAIFGQVFRPPAGDRPVIRRPLAPSIIPGGRILNPVGLQFPTGPGPFGLAVSSGGRWTATADGGPNRYSITLLETHKNLQRHINHYLTKPQRNDGEDDDEWRSVFMGLAFDGEKNLYASDGNSGKVRVLNPADGTTRRDFELNREFGGVSYKDSYSGDLAYDPERQILYVVDQANFRVVVIDADDDDVLASLRLGRIPFAIALSPDRRKLYVTNIGMFEYSPVPGADRRNAAQTGLPFPAFGFPSPASQSGVMRQTGGGRDVKVPGLGDPNVRESNSVCIINVEDPHAPRIEAFVRTGTPFGSKGAVGGSSPSGVYATSDAVFVSNGHNDSITVIDARTQAVTAEIPIRVPGLEAYRGVLPLGLGYHASSGWLFVAEAGLNAVGVIDTKANEVIGHIPVAWFPTRVVVEGDTVSVTNAKGHGTGPNARPIDEETFSAVMRRGSLTIFPVPARSEMANLTGKVFANNGFFPAKENPAPIPPEIQHVVLIVKENRTFDEVFGAIRETVNGKVNGFPPLARFGRNGAAKGHNERFSLQNVNVTPNHQKLAETYAFSDNFYADSEVSVDGHHWIVGAYPNAWTESTLMAAYGGQKDFRMPTTAPGRLLFAGSSSSVHPEEQPEAGTIWHHLERHGISFRNFGEGFELAGINEGEGLKPTGARFLTNVPMPDPLYRNTSRTYPGYNMNIPDQFRASQFIQEIERDFVKAEKPLQVLSSSIFPTITSPSPARRMATLTRSPTSPTTITRSAASSNIYRARRIGRTCWCW